MAELLEVIDSLRAEEASVQRLFANEGQGVRVGRKHTPEHLRKVAGTAHFVEEVIRGKRPFYHFQEAMTTSDFPLLFADILDRQMLANYAEYPSTWRNYVRVASVPDFRLVKRFTFRGGEGTLDEVGELTEYPERQRVESKYEYRVKKYGAKFSFSWEMALNADLDQMNGLPASMARSARRSEQRFVTDLYVDTSGPDATFYAAGNANLVTSNPPLSINALQTAMTILAAQTDEDGEPIFIDMVELVVPPALEITGRNILNAIQLELNEAGGSTNTRLIAQNWMQNKVRLNVDPYIPVIASSANGNTSWFLFASPSNGTPAIEVGYLRGFEQPQIFIKSPNAQRVGGAASPMDGSFELDAIEYKVRHVFGGSLIDPKMSVASNGSGS